MIFVPFANGRPAGPSQDILTGFVDEQGLAFGRPVGVAFDRTWALLVADDVGNRIWQMKPRHNIGDVPSIRAPPLPEGGNRGRGERWREASSMKPDENNMPA